MTRDAKRIAVWCAAMFAGQLAVAAWHYQMFLLFQIDGRRVWALPDDPYITACYARNLAEGAGAVWYPGAPRVEGFSNPLLMLLFAVYHWLPGFTPERLGAFALAGQAPVMAGVDYAAARLILRMKRNLDPVARLSPFDFLIIFAGGLSLVFWVARGFEVSIIALCGLACLALAGDRAATTRGGALGIGILIGVAGWTRMDGVLYCAPACLALLAGRPFGKGLRRLALALGVAAFILGCGLILRRAYYGDWLPNTYYLKLTGWPLPARLDAAWPKNRLWAPAAAAWLALAALCVRQRGWDASALPVVTGLGGLASIAYSMQSGGDAFGLWVGSDRFISVGSLFFGVSCCGLCAAGGGRMLNRAVAVSVVMIPIFSDASFLPALRDLSRPDYKPLERTWIIYGKALREIARPDARVAVRSAGAIIYFARCGGVDLLGKCDPYIAHLPAQIRGRSSVRPGHNKFDDLKMFSMRKPELSRAEPPAAAANDYACLDYKGNRIYVRADLAGLRPEKAGGLDIVFYAARAAPLNLPKTLLVNEKSRVRAEFTNAGPKPWTAADAVTLKVVGDPAHLLRVPAPWTRLNPGQDVPPGGKAVFEGDVLAPPKRTSSHVALRCTSRAGVAFGEEAALDVRVVKAGDSSGAR